MQYFGGKQRIAQQLANFMQPYVDKAGAYYEPFVGGASVISRIRCENRFASDSCKALITMYKAIDSGWLPPECVSEEEYQYYKKLKDSNDPMTAFVGFGCSFAGKWFGGYARGSVDRNYALNAHNSLMLKFNCLKDVNWRAGDYEIQLYATPAVIYCDPPYRGTTQYGACEVFDWSRFWIFCRRKIIQGYKVFISEYDAPDDFTPIFSIETKTDVRMRSGRKDFRTEKLFTLRA